jgi:hypothetical protein
MSEVMENVGAATNVALGIKKSDYEEFINQLDAILSDGNGDPLYRARKVRDHYQAELDFINEIF